MRCSRVRAPHREHLGIGMRTRILFLYELPSHANNHSTNVARQPSPTRVATRRYDWPRSMKAPIWLTSALIVENRVGLGPHVRTRSPIRRLVANCIRTIPL